MAVPEVPRWPALALVGVIVFALAGVLIWSWAYTLSSPIDIDGNAISFRSNRFFQYAMILQMQATFSIFWFIMAREFGRMIRLKLAGRPPSNDRIGPAMLIREEHITRLRFGPISPWNGAFAAYVGSAVILVMLTVPVALLVMWLMIRLSGEFWLSAEAFLVVYLAIPFAVAVWGFWHQCRLNALEASDLIINHADGQVRLPLGQNASEGLLFPRPERHFQGVAIDEIRSVKMPWPDQHAGPWCPCLYVLDAQSKPRKIHVCSAGTEKEGRAVVNFLKAELNL
ncbi:MAG: hypothetical protein AAGK14_03565 [Verrucomicrobiota bacterium]